MAFKAMHNTTLHGIQSSEDNKRKELTSYYPPVKMIYQTLAKPHTANHIAMVGLGVGTSLCAFNKESAVDIYEIDPDVEHLANNTQYFTYMRDCPPKKKIILGDARLMLETAPDNYYDVMVFDAYSSDAIPMHTLTKEALDMYFRKLSKNGILAFHISNRFLDLKAVFAAYAAVSNVHIAQASFKILDKENPLVSSSEWLVLSHDPSIIARLTRSNPLWEPLHSERTIRLWTDQYSNILSVL